MNNDWIINSHPEPRDELLPLVNGNKIAVTLLAQRGYKTAQEAEAFLFTEKYHPAPASQLYGVAHAAELLVQEIRQQHHVLVWGDFDVDGQTSTALLVSLLQKVLNPSLVQYHIPNRFEEGHGIRLPKLQEAVSNSDFQPQCLITCDTGITDHDAIRWAKEAGLKVIITDHHDPDLSLIELVREGVDIWSDSAHERTSLDVCLADAIVDPKFQPPDDPLAALPGVGVAYKLMEQVYLLLERTGEEAESLDLVALGIVADVAEQVQDTRYLLQLGLKKLRETHRIGLQVLMDAANVTSSNLDTQSIGFHLGPRMNALGRMDDATEVVELLTTNDPLRAGQIVGKMERLNQERRYITSQITSSALAMLEQNPEYLDKNAIVLGHEGWHPGIVGIVASKIVEQFNKPTILLVLEEDGTARGSARSTVEVDIGASIAACSEVLLQYGGHPGAAGVTLHRENVDLFRHRLDEAINDHIIADAPEGLQVDCEVVLDQLNMETAESVARLAPFGRGNPEPLFVTRNIRFSSNTLIGQQGLHRRLKVTQPQGDGLEVVWFHCGDGILPQEPIDLVYELGINEYGGERNVQLRYVDSHQSIGGDEAEPKRKESYTVFDYRWREVTPSQLPQSAEAVWYAEGIHVQSMGSTPSYSPREQATRNHNLVLWSIPPTRTLLQKLIETVKPNTIYICARTTTDDTLGHVLRQVAGMAKYTLQQDGTADLERMAARLGTTETVIRLSLLWLVAKGTIAIERWLEDTQVMIRRGSGEGDPAEVERLQMALEANLAEVRAFKRFYQRASMKALGLPTATEHELSFE